MAKVKYRVREFTPKANQAGNHSWFAEAVINSDLDNHDLSDRVAKRTGFKSYECQAIIAAVAEIVAEEVLESNRISLCDERGTKLVSFYPKVSGSVSDKDIQDNPDITDRTVAVEADLTPEKLTWTLGATVGIKFSKNFAINKQAQKVDYNPNQQVAEPAESGSDTTGDNGGGSTPGGNNEEG